MVEHSLGTGLTMRFLYNKRMYYEGEKYFPKLMEHSGLIFLRSQQHDLSKFAHTPEFVEEYYPKEIPTHLSSPVLKFYGLNLRENPDSVSPQDLHEAKSAFAALNIIDDRLLDELIDSYGKKLSLPQGDINQLKKELYQFEHMADLLNRKMFENLSRFRKNHGRTKELNEVFEFGHAINLDNGSAKDWNSGDHTRRIALQYLRSPMLFNLITNISPWLVAQTYRYHTKNSPFLQSPEAIELREKTITEYIENREAISHAEQKLVRRKRTKDSKNQCLVFYAS